MSYWSLNLTKKERRECVGPKIPHSPIHSLFIHSTHILLCSFHKLGAIPGPGVTAGTKTGETLVPMEISLLVKTNTNPIATYM